MKVRVKEVENQERKGIIEEERENQERGKLEEEELGNGRIRRGKGELGK